MAQVFGPEGCTDKFLPIVESMVSDPMFYVRKEAAAAVGSLSTSVDPKTALDRLVREDKQRLITCTHLFIEIASSLFKAFS